MRYENLTNHKKDNVIIQNPPDKPIEISKKDFQKLWNGEALIFSEKLKKQLASQIEKVAVPFKGPHIYFYETNYNFGVVNESDVLSHKFKFKNILIKHKNEYCHLIIAKRNGVNISDVDKFDMVPQEVVTKLK